MLLPLIDDFSFKSLKAVSVVKGHIGDVRVSEEMQLKVSQNNYIGRLNMPPVIKHLIPSQVLLIVSQNLTDPPSICFQRMLDLNRSTLISVNVAQKQ